MKTASWNNVEVALRHQLPAEEGLVMTVPHLPHVPSDWNGILVLAEAQNLSRAGRRDSRGAKKQVAEYATAVRAMDPRELAFRLTARVALPDVGPQVHVKPWHSGPLPLAVACRWPDRAWNACAVTNAVPWAWVKVMSAGKEKDDPGPGRRRHVTEKAIAFLKSAFEDRPPDLVVACGGKATRLARRLPWSRVEWRQGGYQSLINERRVYPKADWTESRLAARLPPDVVACLGGQMPGQVNRSSRAVDSDEMEALRSGFGRFSRRDALLFLLHGLAAPVVPAGVAP